MFDKGGEGKTIEVIVTLTDGRELFGEMFCGLNPQLGKALNGEGGFIELRDRDGHPSFVAKHQISSLEPLKSGKRVMPKLQRAAIDQSGWHNVLGVAPTAGLEEARAAYHRLAKQYHPDVYPEHMPGEMRQYASEMFSRITKAWEQFQAVKRAA